MYLVSVLFCLKLALKTSGDATDTLKQRIHMHRQRGSTPYVAALWPKVVSFQRVVTTDKSIQLGVVFATRIAFTAQTVRPQAFRAVAATLAAPDQYATGTSVSAQIVARSELRRGIVCWTSTLRRCPHGQCKLWPCDDGCGTANAFGLRKQLSSWFLWQRR